MRGLAWVAAAMLAGCASFSVPDEATWHQVANAVASNMDKHPGNDAVAVAAKGAHVISSAMVSATSEPVPRFGENAMCPGQKLCFGSSQANSWYGASE